ncbi:MAG TPA: glucosamine-6-phosphate deaminase [Tissierellaceae bacterium]|nr:glucosamine-6-phosphate deaminase [Tissierellaceae bacterium]
MKLFVEKNYDDLSERASKILIEEIEKNKNIVLGLATGSTPIGTYKRLIKAHKEKGLDFSKAKSFNLDEYVGLNGNHPSSYRYYMDNEFFNHINIGKSNTFVPNGKAENLEEYCKEYDRLIEENGGIDMQILGIGTNGHIAFIEPSEELVTCTSIVKLKESTIIDNSRFFKSIEEVPKTAISMGISSILKAKKIILLANGKNKANAMANILDNDKISTKVPASLLKLHSDVTIILDEEAYSETRRR